MKKKGLIISTIVMVVVLIASLTTATYAWFTTESKASITAINISVAGGSDVLVGVTTTGNYVQNATTDSFYNGSCSYVGSAPSTGTWSGVAGLGPEVSTGLTLNTISKAVSSSSKAYNDSPSASTMDADTAQLTSSYMVKAAGSGATITANSYEEAIQNSYVDSNEEAHGGDYLHFTLGLLANKTNVDTVTLNFTVDPTDSKTSIGMTASMHILYKVDNAATWTNLDVSKGSNQSATYTYATLKTDISQPLAADAAGNIPGQALHAGWQNFSLTIGTANQKLGTDPATDIHQIEIYIYYVGTDSDCNNSALGSAATVYFTVTNTNGYAGN